VIFQATNTLSWRLLERLTGCQGSPCKARKFEAKIANETVFSGGQDITYVCRSAQCAGLDPNYGCQKASDNTYGCRFRFEITLSQEAANRQAAATAKLDVVTENKEQY